MMWDIFKEDLKNTRFILTVLALGLLAFFGLAIILLIVAYPDRPAVPEGLMGLLTTLVGAIIAIVSVAYNSHFKAREDDAAVRVAVASAAVEAATAENTAAGANTAGNTAAGANTAGNTAVGANTAGNTAVGANTAGNTAVGANTAGNTAVGATTAGS